MANLSYQQDSNGNSVAQTQTGPDGAADVNVASGVVGIDPASNLIATANPATSGDTTITTGGTAQYLFASFVPINGFAVYNPDATNDLWVSDSAVAVANGQGSIRVAANGGGYETPAGYKPLGRLSIIGAVTAQKITARRW
jgi:hypothetical protein